jgi:hypothetical protein
MSLRLTDDPPGAEFAEPSDDRGAAAALWVPRDGLERLSACFARRLGLPAAGTLLERLAAAITVLTERGELRPQRRAGANRDRLADWCTRAGIRFETVWFDGRDRQRIHCGHPLFQVLERNGHERTALLQVSSGPAAHDSVFDVRFIEVYEKPDGHPDDIDSRFTYEVSISYTSIDPLTDLLERRGLPRPDVRLGPQERLIADFTALVEREELGAHLPPRANRDLVAGWCRDAGVRHRLGGARRHELLRAEHVDGSTLALTLRFCAASRVPTVSFEEGHPMGATHERHLDHRVDAPLNAVDDLVAFFERRLGLPDAANAAAPTATGWLDDRLIACFEALVAAGDLGDHLPRRENRDRVARWFTEAGAAPTSYGFTRKEELLSVHRSATNCHFDLGLTMDPQPGGTGVSFTESYDYLPQGADPGREYAYGVRTPYASMDALVAFFEDLLGADHDHRAGDLEDRLTRCFRTLVARGELADALPREANRDRVTVWFDRAGVAHKPTEWFWVNSD